MTCACHGEPAYWHPDKRRPSGGFWECAVTRRAASQRRYRDRDREQKLRQQRARYDNDPVYRIEKNLHDHARRRRQTLDRRRAAVHASEQGSM